jgi:hypothetical protein
MKAGREKRRAESRPCRDQTACDRSQRCDAVADKPERRHDPAEQVLRHHGLPLGHDRDGD